MWCYNAIMSVCGFQDMGMQLMCSARVLSVVAYLPHLKYPIYKSC